MIGIVIKRALLFGLIVTALAGGLSAQTYYGSTDITVFREGRDKEFRNKEESPLKEEDFAGFAGLNYFAVDEAFRVNADFTRSAGEEWFQMPTSSGRMKKFIKFGVLKFKLGKRSLKLNVYQIDPAIAAKFPEYGDLLFVPFKDLTSRTETYGGGRYIDIKMPQGKTAILDFNLAYNPNCAYGGDKWNCPIPPKENSLDIAITAGEKRFAYTGAGKGH